MAYAQERYLGLLSQLFTTPEETAMEIIAEREELGFPKPTELFISDVHGEYEEFSHILRNGCGSIRKHIDAAAAAAPCATFSSLSASVTAWLAVARSAFTWSSAV